VSGEATHKEKTTVEDMVRGAIEALKQDLHNIYYRCGREVMRLNKYGELKPYWPKRFRQRLKMAETVGDDEVLAYVKRIVTRPTPTRGFGDLVASERSDLTVEALVVDRHKPYHGLFDPITVATARSRLGI
jgi:hypothetical protein